MALTHNLGYPRIGEQRELKRATEAFWKGQLSEAELQKTAADIRRTNWLKQKDAGIDRDALPGTTQPRWKVGPRDAECFDEIRGDQL